MKLEALKNRVSAPKKDHSVAEAQSLAVEEELRLLREENRRLKTENGSQTISIVELKDSLFQAREKFDAMAEAHRREVQKVKDDAQEKLRALKEKQASSTQEMATKDRFLNQVKTSYKRNEAGVVNAEALIEMGKEFLLEHSVLLPSLWREVAALKNPVLAKKLSDFRREYDRLQIAFQKYTPTKAIIPRDADAPRRVVPREGSVRNSVRNRSFCSVSSIASGKIGANHSRVSMSSAKMSVKSRTSAVSGRSKNSSRTPKKMQGGNLEAHLKKELEDLKNTYKKLIVASSREADSDPLVRERLNQCAQDIQRKTKLLMQARRGTQN